MYNEMKCTAFVVIDTKASEKLTSLLSNTYLLKDLTRLSPSYKTSSLESFLSVMIHYAPHFNENSNRKQLVTRDGQEQYDIIFPKYKKGEYVVRKVLETPTYGNALYLVFHSLL